MEVKDWKCKFKLFKAFLWCFTVPLVCARTHPHSHYFGHFRNKMEQKWQPGWGPGTRWRHYVFQLAWDRNDQMSSCFKAAFIFWESVRKVSHTIKTDQLIFLRWSLTPCRLLDLNIMLLSLQTHEIMNF